MRTLPSRPNVTSNIIVPISRHFRQQPVHRVVQPYSMPAPFKDHRQRIPKNCYKTIFRKINTEEFFSNLHSLQIKTIFQEKAQIAKIYCRGICDLYLWS